LRLWRRAARCFRPGRTRQRRSTATQAVAGIRVGDAHADARVIFLIVCHLRFLCVLQRDTKPAAAEMRALQKHVAMLLPATPKFKEKTS
jgi:hypothetical protein